VDTWTDEHARLLASAAPHFNEDVDLDRVWMRVTAEAAGEARPSTSRRSLRVAVAGVAVVAVGVSGIAAAEFISARTGHGPTDAEDLRLGGPGEKLDPSGADFRDVLLEETADIPFPSAAARQVSIEEHVRDLQGNADPDEPTMVATGAVRAWTAVHAVCAWADEWVVTAGSDAVRHDEAALMLVEARGWPAITDVDPNQTTRRVEQQVLGRDGAVRTEVISDPTQFYYLRRVAAAVQDDDVAALGATLARNAYCVGPSLVPHFPQALPPGFVGR
jgi:hypothetical protein